MNALVSRVTVIAEVERLANQQASAVVVPGLSVAVVHDGKVVYSKGFGVREIGKPEPVDADTVFQLASVSKSIASSVVSAAVTDGKVNFDSRISDLDPSFQMYEPWVTNQVTIRDFLS